MTPKRDPTPLESRSFLGVDVASEPANFISIEAGGSLVIENADPNGVQTSIFFESSATTLTQTLDVTGNAGGFAGQIFGFDQPNDVPTIEQGGLGPNATEMFGFAPNSDSAVPYSLSNFDLTVTSNSIEITFAPCFATGTLIETAR